MVEPDEEALSYQITTPIPEEGHRHEQAIPTLQVSNEFNPSKYSFIAMPATAFENSPVRALWWKPGCSSVGTGVFSAFMLVEISR
jgi:hypothetical protein